MKIYAIMVVKDEIDFVEAVLREAEKWASKIFILDNGSTDGTWELLQRLKNDVITPWKQDFGPYRRGFKGDVYSEFKGISEPGDWWAILDADEFFIEDPRAFLATVPKSYHIVCKKSLDYVFTTEDVEELTFGENAEENVKKLRYITTPCWTEPRFIRFRKSLVWGNSVLDQYPKRGGVVYEKFILVKHYQYRSPAQMQKRLDNRNAIKAKQDGLVFRHVQEKNWKELLHPRANYVLDDGKRETYDFLPVKFVLHYSPIKRLLYRLLIALRIW